MHRPACRDPPDAVAGADGQELCQHAVPCASQIMLYIYIYTHIYACVYMCIHIYLYIYIYREREREIERERDYTHIVFPLGVVVRFREVLLKI